MNIFQRILIWIMRIPYRKGYGVHSPFAFEFIRCVINEDGEYYAYRELRKKYRQGCFLRKIDELLFRLSNRYQPSEALLVGDDLERIREYVSRGCNRTMAETVRWDEIGRALEKKRRIGLLYFDKPDERILPVMGHAGAGSVMVVGNLRKYMPIWEKIQSDEHCGITFDLYHTGICLFDKSLYKQHYKVNF